MDCYRDEYIYIERERGNKWMDCQIDECIIIEREGGG